MSNQSNGKGGAYEYAWIQELKKVLSEYRKTNIVNNSSLEANRRAWDSMNEHTMDLYITSADAAIDTIIELEPLMIEKSDDDLELEFQKDNAGIKGDVRDIVVRRSSIDWEIGLSIKHNHDAIKHSRLSKNLDFGKEWFDFPCSRDYWDAISPIFDKLVAEKNKGTKWSELADKDDTIYVPLLNAFMDEVMRAYQADSSVAGKMVEYLIGVSDYYKIISYDNKRLTVINTFNIHGTLNRKGKSAKPSIIVPVVKMPTEIVALKFRTNSKTTVEMYLNNGWQLSFRIHNASTIVEPSLKFDIQFIGMPVSVMSFECYWDK